jgi:alkylated DNA nucleotide flippase Atl1
MRSWREKLADSKNLPRIEKLCGPHLERYGRGTMLIPAPVEVDEVMRRVPRGKVITINDIRLILAAKHKVTMTCPITTGIFAWIAAHAADEAAKAGKKKITPYWRTLKMDGAINAKYPGGLTAIRKLLAAEGHRIVKRGNRWFVYEYRDAVAKLD